jgi:hypothetical protein
MREFVNEVPRDSRDVLKFFSSYLRMCRDDLTGDIVPCTE